MKTQWDLLTREGGGKEPDITMISELNGYHDHVPQPAFHRGNLLKL